MDTDSHTLHPILVQLQCTNMHRHRAIHLEEGCCSSEGPCKSLDHAASSTVKRVSVAASGCAIDCQQAAMDSISDHIP